MSDSSSRFGTDRGLISGQMLDDTSPKRGADLKPKHFGWKVEGKVATLTLNRPERKNPITFQSYAEMRDLFRALCYVEDVKAVVVTGAGGNFCSGGDVHEIIGPLVEMQRIGDMAGLLAFTRMTGDLVKAMRACPQPIVAAVDGVCAGAGAILAMASDLRYGTARSKIAFLFVRVGLAGADMGACNMLPRIIGSGRAAELLYTADTVDAQTALAWGLVSRVVPAATLMDEARGLAERICRQPPDVLRMTKRLLRDGLTQTFDAVMELSASMQALAHHTEDHKEAVAAFFEKREPRFQGR